MFRIVCEPSSGSTELYLTEIRSGSQMLVVCLVGVWQRSFEPVVCVCVCVCVCVYGTTGPGPSYRHLRGYVLNSKHISLARMT
jgi:hypothetical protein